MIININGMLSISSGTSAEWAALSFPIPDKTLFYVSDKKIIKQGDGTNLYNNLPIFFNTNILKDLQPGQIILWPQALSSSLPDGFVAADGSYLSQTTYADLFTIYGTTFGSDSGTFALPTIPAFSSMIVLIKY